MWDRSVVVAEAALLYSGTVVAIRVGSEFVACPVDYVIARTGVVKCTSVGDCNKNDDKDNTDDDSSNGQSD